MDVYWFTWNVFLHGAEGKDGITSDKGAPRTIEYFRASVRATIKTYPLLGPKLHSWLTVRNGDIYSFRWADLDYARAFIKAIPGPDKVAGFYMGTDGYLWGRDFLTKDPDGPRPTVMQKQRLSFTLWGRLAYEPDLPAATFQRLTAARFPGADVPTLTTAWADASKTFPFITRFFWGDIDLKWLPEACLSHPRFRGYYTVRHFIEGGTMPGSGVTNIIDWRTKFLAGQDPRRVRPRALRPDRRRRATIRGGSSA